MSDPQRQILRYRIPIRRHPYIIDWPVGANPIHVEAIGDEIDLWADVPNPDAPRIGKPFLVAATGALVKHELARVGTVLQRHHTAPDGRFVWHVFHNPKQGAAVHTWDGAGRIVETREVR